MTGRSKPPRSEITDDFSTAPCGNGLVDAEVDVFTDKVNGTISQDKLSSSRVLAAEVVKVCGGGIRYVVRRP